MPIPDRIGHPKECFELDDDVRWLVALISDTGMRLAEAAGLLASDIHLDADVPHIALRKTPWRSLKTEVSATSRLVGMSLWAAGAVEPAGLRLPKIHGRFRLQRNLPARLSPNG